MLNIKERLKVSPGDYFRVKYSKYWHWWKNSVKRAQLRNRLVIAAAGRKPWPKRVFKIVMIGQFCTLPMFLDEEPGLLVIYTTNFPLSSKIICLLFSHSFYPNLFYTGISAIGKPLYKRSAVQMEFCQIAFQPPHPEANGRFVGTISAENR